MAMTLDGTTGIVLPSAAAPAFSAYLSTNQNFSTGTWTKVLINQVEWDTAGCFSNGRFTPNVAGYYQINASIYMSSDSTATWGYIMLVRNNIHYKMGADKLGRCVVSSIVFCNGSTDYIEIHGSGTFTGQPFFGASGSTYDCWMNGALIRST